MKPKQLFLVVLTVIVASTISGLVAYRLALRPAPQAWRNASAPASSQGSAPAGCFDLHDASAHTGQSGCVSGRLLRVFTSHGGNSFLDFCPDYRNCAFTSVIFATDKSKFGDLGSLAGRQIEIQGNITNYQGKAEIIIRDPQQIHVLP